MSASGPAGAQAASNEDALELFVEVLSQAEEVSTPDAFYGRLCEAVCRLAAMRRALIFRYDGARRMVRAAGAHGIDLSQLAGAHVTLVNGLITDCAKIVAASAGWFAVHSVASSKACVNACAVARSFLTSVPRTPSTQQTRV